MKCSAFHPGGSVFFFALFAMLILTLALGILVAPLAAVAQPPGKVYRIGYLGTVPHPPTGGMRSWTGCVSEGIAKGGTSSSSAGSRKATRSDFQSSPPSWSGSGSISSSCPRRPQLSPPSTRPRRFRSSFRRLSIPWERG
jgi:hypothetical protein